MNERYEAVHTVNHYYDGPRTGVADFQGAPHFYQSEFDYDRDGRDETFLLTLIDQETFRMELEAWQIWIRWSDAFKTGSVTIDTHPALPIDRPRYDELQRMLKSRLVTDKQRTVRVKANFRVSGTSQLEVCWTAVT